MQIANEKLANPAMQGQAWGEKKGSFLTGFRCKKQKRIPFLKNKARKSLITNVWPPKTKLNKPKNKPGKLLKIRSCVKNKPENEPGHVVENTR